MSQQLVFVNFATTSVNQQGRFVPVDRALLRNIRGFPVDLTEIKTVQALNGVLDIYFANTLRYYGLNLQYIIGYGAVFFSEATKSYSISPIPAENNGQWRIVFDHLTNNTMPQNHCPGEKCIKCQHPPFVIACFDESAFFNALLSNGLNTSSVSLQFLDGSAAVLNAKFNRSSIDLKQAYIQLKTNAAEGGIVRSLATPIASTQAHPPSARPPPTALANLLSNTSATTSMKRPVESDDDIDAVPKKRKTNPRSKSGGQNKKKRVVDWTKATPKPKDNTKALTDTCLTCLNQGRNCKGTTINDQGKCENCQGNGEKGLSKRRCFWQNPDEELWTYDQVKAKSKKPVYLKENTSEYRALRNQSQISSIATPSSFNTDFSQHTIASYSNDPADTGSQASNGAPRGYTSADLTNTDQDSGAETTNLDLPNYIPSMNYDGEDEDDEEQDEDDDTSGYLNEDSIYHTLSSDSDNDSVTDNEHELSEPTSNNDNYEEDIAEPDETTEEM